MSPGPVKISRKKMAVEGGRIDFMFLGPLPLTQPLDPLVCLYVRVCVLYKFNSRQTVHKINILTCSYEASPPVLTYLQTHSY